MPAETGRAFASLVDLEAMRFRNGMAAALSSYPRRRMESSKQGTCGVGVGAHDEPQGCLGAIHLALRSREDRCKKTYKALTLPQKKMRRRDMVTLGKLTRHFGMPATESLDWTACVQCRSARVMVCD